ncbi:hypothetical protein CFC21_106789 [Triticum aestivum]|uniref:Pierisin-like domain-containing protein n=2 Tax=Triticum aestivum TaxID=4565 RepID=A0A9R1MF10_WHEAT|nr:uncharacterized protein LOC123167196 [Triticum aestivum]KAF7106024.1 hypothetical protein CFC21_106789 [Triticum aestivum]
MSISPDAPSRGGAACLRQNMTEDDETNIRPSDSNSTILRDIEYRSSDRCMDISNPVYRFDLTPYESVFRDGFKGRFEMNTPNSIYCNLELYLHHGVMPATITRRPDNYIFFSTTLSRSWFPNVRQARIYRYEIYAPGGIWLAQTFRQCETSPDVSLYEDEVAFLVGIAPQYIRSAQAFRLIPGRNGGLGKRLEDVLYINRNFNPQSHPPRDIPIMHPIMEYIDYNNQTRPLRIQYVPEEIESMWPYRRSLGTTNDVPIEYYAEGVAHIASYIDSAFRSTYWNEVYIFIKEKYVLVNYAPGSTNDRILNGPHYIGDSFPFLVGTAFAEYGIDASFGSHSSVEAIIFSGNLCARINFAPKTTGGYIVEGITTIRQMFPFFRGTVFEKGIDAAFESTVTGEAYLFKGSNYALINYYKKELIAITPIAVGFQCLRDSEFEGDIGAAFASHICKEAYLFKGNRYILLHFTPGENKDYIVDGPKDIVPGNWPSLDGVLPCRNIGLDVIGFPHGNPLPEASNHGNPMLDASPHGNLVPAEHVPDESVIRSIHGCMSFLFPHLFN